MRFKTFLTVFSFAGLLTVSASPVQAKMYKYTDSSGNLHVVDDIDKVPAKYREKVQMRKSVVEPEAPPPPAPETPPADGAVAGTPAQTLPVAGGEAAAGEKKGPTDKQGHDENFWRQKFQSCDQRANSLREQIESIELSGVTGDPGTEERQRKIAEAKKKLADRQKECRSLRDEARKAGAPPAWLR